MLKQFAKRLAVNSGSLRVISTFAGKGIAVLMYHSVSEDPASFRSTLGDIGHQVRVFERQMELLARSFHVISLDETLLFIRGQRDVPRRSVVVTFDDGYADNYNVAIPLLNKLGIPSTFYVTVDCVQQKRLPWPSRIRYALFSSRKPVWVDPDGQSWPLRDDVQRGKAFDRACQYCGRLADAEQDRFVALVESDLECVLAQGPLMMTWDEVRGCVKQGHIIGSHTMTHPNMAHIPADAMQREMAESKKILDRELGFPVVHFSYPCPALQPHWNAQSVQVSDECGYETAVTTNGGLVRRGDHPLHLRRIRPSKTVEGLRANLEVTFAGHRA